MLDTAHKGKGRLLDHMSIGELSAFVGACHELDLKAGLAGGLEAPDAPRLLVPSRTFSAFAARSAGARSAATRWMRKQCRSFAT